MLLYVLNIMLGYCEKCKQNVSLTKGDFNIPLFCILWFTGIGWLIYLILWSLIAEENKCIVCGLNTQPPREIILDEDQRHIIPNESEEQSKFCKYCGFALESISGTHCPNCGGEF